MNVLGWVNSFNSTNSNPQEGFLLMSQVAFPGLLSVGYLGFARLL
jgi:hypothetical protein